MTEWKSFQDFKPVVLTKNKQKANVDINAKTNIHIKKVDDTDELPKVLKYSQEQIDIIRNARTAKGLTQPQLSKLISPNIKSDFITNIENGKTPFDNRTYNTILRKLNVLA